MIEVFKNVLFSFPPFSQPARRLKTCGSGSARSLSLSAGMNLPRIRKFVLFFLSFVI